MGVQRADNDLVGIRNLEPVRPSSVADGERERERLTPSGETCLFG
jgi:hypothetical protein